MNVLIDRIRTRARTGSVGLRPDYLVIRLTLTRPLTPAELMHHLLRGLYRHLHDCELLDTIPQEIRSDLELAFHRTSLEISFATSSERTGSIGLKGPAGMPVAELLSLNSETKIGASRALKYVAYDDKAAEQDLVAIAQRLVSSNSRRSTWRSKWLRLLWFRRRDSRFKILFLFDELDKLESTSGATQPEGAHLDLLLDHLKGLFTTSGITFLFVGGKDLHTRWLADLARGDSIYESVFASAVYIPALWNSVDAFCDPLVLGSSSSPEYHDFKRFLAFKGRGIPRRIIRGLNDYVRWENDQPKLSFTRTDCRKFKFFAGLLDLLQRTEERLFASGAVDRPDRVDQRRLGIYYLIDWMLQRGRIAFTVEDAVGASKSLSRAIAFAEDVLPEVIRTLLRILTEAEYLEIIGAEATNALPPGAGGDAATRLYRVPSRRLVELGSETDAFGHELAVVRSSTAASFPERYREVELIGRGGMGSVYRAYDAGTRRQVAIKELAIPEWNEGGSLRRLEREIEILAALDHPNIVRIYDSHISSERGYLVMEYVAGPTLKEVIGARVLASVDEAVAVMRALLLAVGHLHFHRVLWRDAKPSNIIVTEEGRLVLVDFGLARRFSAEEPALSDQITGVGTILGTPAYMPPEQALGERADARSDIYSLGVIFYELLTGVIPFAGGSPMSSIRRRLTEIPVHPKTLLAEIPASLDDVIMRCLARIPDDRFSSVEDVLERLPTTTTKISLAAKALQAMTELRHDARREAEATGSVMLSFAHDEGSGARKADWSGGSTIKLEAEAIQPDTTIVSIGRPEPEKTAVLVLESADPQVEFQLKAARMTIGRTNQNDLPIDDSTLSRYHARITRRDDGEFVVEDMGSSNGTIVNGQLIDEERRLENGDVIQLGAVKLRFELR